jgi:hypothetical protein
MIGAVPALDESGKPAENTFQIGELADVVPPPWAAKPAPPVPQVQPAQAPTSKPIAAQPADLSPRAIVKSIRARIKAIRAELKSHAALKAELAELERLLAAATGKPLAPVRTIESARRSG